MTGTIPPTTDERERIIDRIRREGREEGRREALDERERIIDRIRREGREEGRREALEERERIRREGREEGLEQGLERGRRALLVEVLQSRFGELSAEALHRIQTGSTSEVDRWAKRLGVAASLTDIFDETPL